MKGKEIVQPNICGLKQSKYQSSIVLSKARNANPWALAARFEYSSAYGGNSDLQGVSQLSVFLQAIKHLFRVDGSLHIQNLATQSYMVGQAHVDQLSGQGNAGLRYSVALKESEAISVASEDASLKRIRGPTATVRSRRPHRVACGSGEGFSTVYDDLGDGDQQCHYCGAAFWYGERLKGHSISQDKCGEIYILEFKIRLYNTERARGLYDAISRGERDGYEVGGRLILPMSFTGGPRTVANHSSVVHHQAYQEPVIDPQLQPSFLQIDSGLVVSTFLLSDDLIASLNKAMMEELQCRQFRGDRLRDNGDTVTTGQASQEIPTPVIFQANDLDAFSSDYDEVPSASAVLMAKLSAYDSDVLSEVPHPDTYQNNNMINQKTKNKAVQDTTSSTYQDTAMIMSLIEEVSNQVAKSLGYQNPVYLSQAQRKATALYCGRTIVKKHDVMTVMDTEETLILAEESRLIMHAEESRLKRLILHPLIMLL
ncbi:hypothetical protein Tco_0162674 [Tanacetum coccineum]